VVIRDLLAEGVKALSDLEFSDSSKESRIILCHLLGKDESYLYAHGDEEISEEAISDFRTIVDRRKNGEPLQYILGFQEFMGFEFLVKPGVLIPRGDTEFLVEAILNYAKKAFADNSFRMLDIGAGSGAISLSVAKLMKNSKIIAIDISSDAIALSNENKIKLNIDNAEFLQGNLFSALGEVHENSFDIIASNPPYIPDEEIETLQAEVRLHEPKLALAGGKDGLDFYREIVNKSLKYLKKGGLLIFEVGHDQGEAVAVIMRNNGYDNIEIINDFENRNRVVSGRL
jgi:release factor glutamine methyltransferase